MGLSAWQSENQNCPNNNPTRGEHDHNDWWFGRNLVRQARMAQDAEFERLWISDHFHPWNDEQGQSPFVWSVIGALSEAVTLPVTTR